MAENARELALLIETTRRKAGGEGWPVVLSGGLSGAMLPRLRVLTKADVRRLTVHPAVSAAAIAQHRSGMKDAAQRLLKEGAAL